MGRGQEKPPKKAPSTAVAEQLLRGRSHLPLIHSFNAFFYVLVIQSCAFIQR